MDIYVAFIYIIKLKKLKFKLYKELIVSIYYYNMAHNNLLHKVTTIVSRHLTTSSQSLDFMTDVYLLIDRSQDEVLSNLTELLQNNNSKEIDELFEKIKDNYISFRNTEKYLSDLSKTHEKLNAYLNLTFVNEMNHLKYVNETYKDAMNNCVEKVKELRSKFNNTSNTVETKIQVESEITAPVETTTETVLQVETTPAKKSRSKKTTTVESEVTAPVETTTETVLQVESTPAKKSRSKKTTVESETTAPVETTTETVLQVESTPAKKSRSKKTTTVESEVIAPVKITTETVLQVETTTVESEVTAPVETTETVLQVESTPAKKSRSKKTTTVESEVTAPVETTETVLQVESTPAKKSRSKKATSTNDT